MFKLVPKFFRKGKVGPVLDTSSEELYDFNFVSTTSHLVHDEDETQHVHLLKRLSIVASAFDVGNIWRFSFKLYSNNGCFLYCYFIMMIFVGIPIYFMETAVGQFTSKGLLRAFNCVPILSGIKFAMYFISFYMGLYNSRLISIFMQYLLFSFTSKLPWTSCSATKSFASDLQVCVDTKKAFERSDTCNNTNSALVNVSSACHRPISSAEKYWLHAVLELSGGIDDFGKMVMDNVGYYIIVWLIIYAKLTFLRGQSPKLIYLSSTFPFLVLFAFFINNVKLKNAQQGLIFFFVPKWKSLKEARVWKDAASQVLFSLTTCSGTLLTKSSFNLFQNNCERETWLYCSCSVAITLMVGLSSFSLLGHSAYMMGTSVDQVVSHAPGLPYVVYSETLAHMPTSLLWSCIFLFTMLVVLIENLCTLTKTLVIYVNYNLPSRMNRKRNWAAALVVGSYFSLGLVLVSGSGLYWIVLLDSIVVTYSLITTGLLELVTVSYIYGLNRFAKDIKMMLGKEPLRIWRWCWCFCSPLVLLITLIAGLIEGEKLALNNREYPRWANYLAWGLYASCFALVPLKALHEILLQPGTLGQRIKQSSKPHSKWRPHLQEDRGGQYDVPFSELPQHKSTPVSPMVPFINELLAEKTSKDSLTENDWVTDSKSLFEASSKSLSEPSSSVALANSLNISSSVQAPDMVISLAVSNYDTD